MLRQAQHERKKFNDFRLCPVHPELVEGWSGSLVSPFQLGCLYRVLHYLIFPVFFPRVFVFHPMLMYIIFTYGCRQYVSVLMARVFFSLTETIS